MNTKDVHNLLQANKNERGISNWVKLGRNTNLKSYGIGLTQLRKLAKKIGRDHDLALKLWESDYYDAKIIALLIDDPKLITKEQAEKQVEELQGGHLAHVFSSCDATLAKTSFTKEIADEWMKSNDPMRKSCGYGLLYELSKSKKKNAPDNSYFLKCIRYIDKSFKNEPIHIQMSMGGALLGIGKRHIELHSPALKLAQKMGPIDFDKSGKCDPFDVAKNLSSKFVKEKFGIK